MIAAAFEARGATIPLPAPDGPFAVGTRVVQFTDASRRDPAVASRDREIVVQVWYPAASAGPYERYLDSPAVARRLREHGYYEVPAAEIDWWCVLPTHSARNAPISRRSRFPLLTFSIGSGVGRFNYTSIIEELASHGYIVAAIDHPYGGVTALSDGRVISTANVTSRGDDEASAAELTEEWAHDIHFVIGRLPILPFLRGRIDRRRIGAFGHSLGGAAALEAARIDPTIRAAADMDGGTFGDVGRLGLEKPCLILRSSPQYSDEDLAKRGQTREGRQRLAATFDAMFRDFFARHRDVRGYVMKVRRTGHFSFSDAPFVMPQTITRFGGDILDAETTWRRVTSALLAFFDFELRGKKGDLLVTRENEAFSVQVFGPGAATHPQ
jgi:pimeloyl-ACP methyl ester carboxylesterase